MISIFLMLMIDILIFLLLDYNKLRIIRFKPDGQEYWRIAFSDKDMFAELDGRMAEVIMPAQPIIIRVWRFFRPLKGSKIDISPYKPAKPEGD